MTRQTYDMLAIVLMVVTVTCHLIGRKKREKGQKIAKE